MRLKLLCLVFIKPVFCCLDTVPGLYVIYKADWYSISTLCRKMTISIILSLRGIFLLNYFGFHGVTSVRVHDYEILISFLYCTNSLHFVFSFSPGACRPFYEVLSFAVLFYFYSF